MQVYDTLPYLLESPVVGVIDFKKDLDKHEATEARQPTESEMNTMVDQVRMAFLKAFGEDEYEKAVSPSERKATANRLANEKSERERGH